jgi:hypothetical protein
LLALVGVGVVALAIAWYFEPALRGLFKKIGGIRSTAANKPVLETR